jgi:hypothetical protein
MKMPSMDRQQASYAILERLVAYEAISLAFLANEDGLLVAAVPETEQAAVAAAVGASLHHLTARVAEGRSTDEIAIQFEDRQKLVCRPVPCDRTEVLLGVYVQANRPYRRLTGWAIREICAVWMAG